MKRILAGHRGTGKTSLLERHRQYAPNIPHFDLDEEIEKEMGQTLAEYFSRVGENEFRDTEKKIFARLVQNHRHFVIAPGAGFDISSLSGDMEVIYVSRTTDTDGRIFMNRPRLETDMPPLQEYRRRFEKRQTLFIRRADMIYHLPEGLEQSDPVEAKILSGRYQVEGAYYTINMSEVPRLPVLMQQYPMIELRTDLIAAPLIEDILEKYPDHQWLTSIRNTEHIELKNAEAVDVDYWYYKPGMTGVHVVSSHVDGVEEGIHQLGEVRDSLHLKLCPLVEKFSDLIIGYRWQQRDPENRSFLPRSADGRWVWYRQLSKYLQKLNFVKGFSDVPDQPSVYEWLVLPENDPAVWAAVLGEPVHFSRSPVRHGAYFASRNSFFTRVQMSEKDFEKYLDFLIELGLCYAAVTSPLKKAAYDAAKVRTPEAQSLQAVNTLWLKGHELYGHNTDHAGFAALTAKLPQKASIAVWGGGGTLKMIQSVLPQAEAYSSRTGDMRNGGQNKISYDYLIWAAPRYESTLYPADGMAVGHVVDLNYIESSMGLEFAANRKVGYTSGLEMFNEQARQQQKYWSEHERE